ncbi:MAG: DNA-directed DNA polymerase II small subunit [Candidatus Woesearchaeota archaeon]
MSTDSKAKLVRTLLEKGVLITDEMLEKIDSDNFEKLMENIDKKSTEEMFYDNSYMTNNTANTISANNTSTDTQHIINVQRKVKVVFTYEDNLKKKDFSEFVKHYNLRYNAIKSMLQNRPDLLNLLSISKVLNKQEKDNVSIIGMVMEKSLTKSKNILLKIEDPTGLISVIINKTKQDVYDIAQNIVEDEVVGVYGFNDDKVIFCNKLLQPDVNHNKELKKAPLEEYAIFLSDIHVGSIDFLEDKFLKFLKWLRGEIGSEEQKILVKKIKYIFIVGDLVDGVGIYPNQEKELSIKDIYEQYNKFSEYISLIPEHMTIIISPGNHDAVRLAEPQPPIADEFIKPMLSLPNVIFVSNPAMINICGDEDFSGFDVLMYHGYSFDYYISNVDYIRNNGGYDRADLVMKFLLQRRHLAPTHTSTLFIPDSRSDQLVISKLPDFFVTGHIHKTALANYHNITLISGSCWQSTTPFQEKVGHKPEPARVPIVNLQTRQAKILRF